MIGDSDPRRGAVARRGRKTKLTEATQRVIVEGVAAGVPFKYAAQRAGIDESTLHLWMRKGRRAKKGPHFQLFQSLKKAEADAVARNVAVVQNASTKSWQAAAWWLERRHHKEFGRQDRTVVQAQVKGPDLGAEVRRRLDEAGGRGHRQPGQDGGAGAQELADSPAPQAHQ